MPNLENYRSKGFQRRFAEALRVRLYPNSTLRLKQLAAGINRSEHSISRWWHGESRPLAEDIDRMAVFFAKQGDRNFLADVFGEAKSKPETVSNERMIEFFRKLMADAAEGVAAKDGTHGSELWCDADGNLALAPLGHAKYVASVLGMPMSGDLVRYAASVLGWIAVTIQPDDAVAIHHDGRRIAPLAAERACEWLKSKRDTTPLVKRIIQVEGRWIDAYHDTPELAAVALAKIACIVRTPRRQWKVTQLSLDKVEHPRLRRLLRIHHEAPDKIIHAAADMGAFTVSGVFSVDGEDVVSHHVPTEFHDLDPRLIEGKNVLSRADTDYALMIRARLINAKSEGATYHDLSGSVNNFNVHYRSLALAEPGLHGRVLSSTVVLDMQPVG
jgi:transcriptional regulator with XRE-family HTH domain